MLGFACYDTTHKNFFGPTGVDAAKRGQGIGTALLLATLHAMREAGYMYAIIGGGRSGRVLRKGRCYCGPGFRTIACLPRHVGHGSGLHTGRAQRLISGHGINQAEFRRCVA